VGDLIADHPADTDVAGWDRVIASHDCAFIHGNHDVRDPHGWWNHGRSLTGIVREWEPDLLIAGIGWHGRQYADLPGSSEWAKILPDIDRQLNRLRTRRHRLVIATHYPPLLNFWPHARAMFPPHPGESFALGEWCYGHKPDAIIMGHVHHWCGISAGRLGDPWIASSVVPVNTMP
jgi:Icc-related predicted phosphoesterase